jgi:hypothetical protein
MGGGDHSCLSDPGDCSAQELEPRVKSQTPIMATLRGPPCQRGRTRRHVGYKALHGPARAKGLEYSKSPNTYVSGPSTTKHLDMLIASE